MSVNSTHISQSFLKDGRTANFTFTFECLKSEPTSVKARLLNSVNPNTYSTLAYNTDYTVAVNANGGGGIITLINTGGTETLFVYRQTSDTQDSDYTDYNQFPADTLEYDLDRRTMRSQEADDGVSRAVKFDVSSSISGITLPVPENLKALKWSGTGGTLINSTFDPDSSATICVSAQTVSMAAATAASISQIAAASSATIAATQASIATTQATLAASSATVALIASSISSIHYVTTASYINTAFITQATITATTIGTITITSAATANMMDMAVATAGNLLVTTRATIASATITTITLSAGTIAKEVNIAIPTTGATPTFTTQADFNKLFGSAGRATGGNIVSASTTSIIVSAGTGFIKATDDDTATLLAFNWPSTGTITIATNTTTYVKVTYNGGVPTVSTTTTSGDWDLDTSFPLGSVVQENGIIHVMNNPWWITDGTTNIIERVAAEGRIIRDADIGGLVLSTTADRRISLTAGQLWSRLNEFAISAVATNSSFQTYWRTSSTVWVGVSATTLSSISFNNLTTNTLTNLTANRYFNWWVYLDCEDGTLNLVYPQAQFTSSAAAEAEAPPSSVPLHVQTHNILVGRVIMQQGTTAPIQTDSAFTTVFTPTQAADHGNLTGLSDDDHTQYVAVTGTRSATIPTLTITTSATIPVLSAGLVTEGNLMVTTSANLALATAGNLTVTTAATILSLSAPTHRSTTSTITNITASTISFGTSISYPTIVKSVEVETPGGAENITLFKVASAATIAQMYAVVRGTSPSVTWVVKHGTDRSAGGTSVLTAGTTTTDTTTGSTVTAFSNASISAGSWVWLTTTATSGTINSLNVTINYRMDA